MNTELKSLLQKGDSIIRSVVERYNNLDVLNDETAVMEIDIMQDDIKQLYLTFKQISYHLYRDYDSKNLANIAPNGNIADSVIKSDSNFVEETNNVSEYTDDTDISDENSYNYDEPIDYEQEVESDHDINSEIEEKFAGENLFSAAGVDIDNYEIVEKRDTTRSDSEKKYLQNNAEHIATQDQEQGRASNFAETTDIKPKNNNESNMHNENLTIGETFTNNEVSINDTIKDINEQQYSFRPKLNPISNLSEAINLNEKFTFIADLFEGNEQAYDEAIKRLERAVNYDEAMWILDSMRKPHWSENIETAHLLKDFVHRRYI
ncbi:MAG: hypothetical protein PHP31_05940 [Lentimicrobiaceae bacterium]|nr:hypothetical protein [Lentimicrobiaceae bacterium]